MLPVLALSHVESHITCVLAGSGAERRRKDLMTMMHDERRARRERGEPVSSSDDERVQRHVGAQVNVNDLNSQRNAALAA